ncbi:DUF1203 domain-containing protein [Marilutibacter aestuarii]|uniref:DUF1203 domain-containing protein n=1 Tax=Marilutibacter aestuarii TaxID=1706195 RepID=A0A508A0J8_9GAMM|nr:DUF1203 domain-containing protein [Lysobacter aestuarii]TQD42361.1 DUF1203 domain-containing protein [Lysobacter aestuarii]
MATTPHFRITALPADAFEALFELDDTALAARGARRLVAVHPRNFPCRVSLVDAAVGEEVLLVTHPYHDSTSPYRASGAVFVRRHARQARPGIDEVPPRFRSKLLSVRAYGANGDLLDADVVAGDVLEPCISAMLGRGEVDFLHLHHARHGCYLCRVDRVAAT